MEEIYLYCPIEGCLISELQYSKTPCSYSVDGCVCCPHVIEVDEDGNEVEIIC